MSALVESNTCPRCGSMHLKPWTELNDEQKFLAERLPMSVEYPPETRKKHCFCTQCWFEETGNISKLA